MLELDGDALEPDNEELDRFDGYGLLELYDAEGPDEEELIRFPVVLGEEEENVDKVVGLIMLELDEAAPELPVKEDIEAVDWIVLGLKEDIELSTNEEDIDEEIDLIVLGLDEEALIEFPVVLEEENADEIVGWFVLEVEELAVDEKDVDKPIGLLVLEVDVDTIELPMDEEDMEELID